MIKIAVNGAGGRMGSLLIENILRSNDMQLVTAIVANMEKAMHLDLGNIPVTDAKNSDAMLERLKPDVLIDFTNASCAVEIIKSCAHNGSNIVVGTTGFSNEQQIEIENTIKKSNITAVISPNFSIGVNVFWGLIAEAAKRFEDGDIEIMESHHIQKKDAPSGTAINAAMIISETLGGKDFVYGRHGISPRQKEIGIHAIRGGDIIGDHVVLFSGDGERLEIKHQAHSRQAFAKGALLAARWVINAPGGMYSMEDVLGI